jgi:hypothetical protein
MIGYLAPRHRRSTAIERQSGLDLWDEPGISPVDERNIDIPVCSAAGHTGWKAMFRFFDADRPRPRNSLATSPASLMFGYLL